MPEQVMATVAYINERYCCAAEYLGQRREGWGVTLGDAQTALADALAKAKAAAEIPETVTIELP